MPPLVYGERMLAGRRGAEAGQRRFSSQWLIHEWRMLAGAFKCGGVNRCSFTSIQIMPDVYQGKDIYFLCQ